MGKPEWGMKRRCQTCSCAFYDFAKTPIICPKCETEFKPETLLKPRRARPEEAPAPKPVPVKAPVEAVVEEEEIAEEELIEDAAELGEDEDDVAEVIEGADEPARE